MNLNTFFYFFLVSITLIACDKNNKPEDQTPLIDVTKQWTVDLFGIPIMNPGDGQWQNKTFNTQEQNLFVSLDTTNLASTNTPDSVIEVPHIFNCIYPNPFANFHRLSFGFTNGFSGEYVLKYVIVDNFMNALDKKAVRMKASINNTIGIMPNVPIGKFRVYYTLSSEENKHFYKSWGNVERTQ